MNGFDIVIVILIITAFIKGLMKGFISELATLVGLILGIIGAVLFSGIVANWLIGRVSSQFIPVLSFLILFVGIIFCVYLLAKLIDSFIKAIALGWLNRIAGGFFSVFKIMFIVSVLILIVDRFGIGEKIIKQDVRNKSLLFEPVRQFAPKTFELFKLKYEHLLPTKELSEPSTIVVKTNRHETNRHETIRLTI